MEKSDRIIFVGLGVGRDRVNESNRRRHEN